MQPESATQEDLEAQLSEIDTGKLAVNVVVAARHLIVQVKSRSTGPWKYCDLKSLLKHGTSRKSPAERLQDKLAFCGTLAVMTRIGILAYGSLIDSPGEEIANATVYVVQEGIMTPFNVEFARASQIREGAPTLVPSIRAVARSLPEFWCWMLPKMTRRTCFIDAKPAASDKRM